MTSRGMKEKEMAVIVDFINQVIDAVKPIINLKYADFIKEMRQIKELHDIRAEVGEFCSKYPFYEGN